MEFVQLPIQILLTIMILDLLRKMNMDPDSLR